MKQTPEQALAVLLSLVSRAAVNDIEVVGANLSVLTLQAALKELSDFKNPPKPEQ